MCGIVRNSFLMLYICTGCPKSAVRGCKIDVLGEQKMSMEITTKSQESQENLGMGRLKSKKPQVEGGR